MVLIAINSKKIEYPYAGTVNTASGNSNLELFKHQNDAIKNLNDKILNKGNNPFAGLLVLPTGGGKTLTATYWLLKNYTNQNKKILWIAHRHELLEQAKHSFEQLAYSDILNNRSSFNYRIISGLHDKPVNIEPTDDIIISSKDSLNKGFKFLYKNWIKNNHDEIFLVIDEAHHATAKTYRRLINQVNEKVKAFKMLGLTATPFRTAESEKGHLKKVFPDDVIYQIDLRTLINRGILSEPIFKEIKTDFDMTKVLNEKELDHIKFFDIDSIGRNTAKSIAQNSKRNHCIVDHYIENKSKYKQTLVFALNIDNAIALNSLFKRKGVKSEFVVSSIRDAITKVSVSSKDNKEKIARFRRGELEVLVNVNILTEGTDLPEIRTVFLARPTISTILMTQMIGRGLRGVEAGGTDIAYIVGFIDDWKDKVSWVNPEKLFIAENIDFDDKTSETEKKFTRLVSIEKIEEFASIMDKSVDTKELESMEFIERVPIGLYSFSILKSHELEKNCEILVYSNINQAYEDFIGSLQDFFIENNIGDKETLNEEELITLSEKIEDIFFYGSEKYPGYLIEDIKDILFLYAQKGEQPDLIKFTDRDKFDLTKIAKEIYDNDWGGRAKKRFLEDCWNKDENEWKVFFGFDKKYFINEVDLILRKMDFPDLFITNVNKPITVQEERNYQKLSMSELRDYVPKYWKKLSDKVFEKYKDDDGFYFSAKSDFKSKSKLNFQIDHIIPLSKGGLTKLDNLQLLTRKENVDKGDKYGCSFEKTKINDLYYSGVKFLNDENYDQAVVKFEKIKNCNNIKTDVLIYLCTCYSKMGLDSKLKEAMNELTIWSEAEKIMMDLKT